jgi:hypothetical protein
MFHINEGYFVNPDGIAYIEYIRRDVLRDQPYFTVVFLNHEIVPLYLRGEAADEALLNWQRWYDATQRHVAASDCTKQAQWATPGEAQ